MKARWFVTVVTAAFLAPSSALAAGQTRTIEIAVTANGFEPARVKVAKDVPLKLVVTRKTDDTCAKEIVIPDENIRADLPLDKPVTLSFTPKRAGEIRYACGMNMITGVLEVASSDSGRTRGMSRMQGAGERMKDEQGCAMHRTPCGCMHRATGSSSS